MAKRRNSVEWAQWTHDQNQEMLNTLKMEAFASPVGRSQEEAASGTPGVNHDKMSKLLSRKNRTPGGGWTPQQTALPSRGQHPGGEAQRLVSEETPSVPSERLHPHQHLSEETSYLEAEIAHLKAEKGLLLEDQARLVSIIQSDNTKMMEVLNEVKASKQKMLDKIETLEKERLKLKAFSAEVIENNIESILSSMPLSLLISKRDGSDKHEPAEELHSKLVELVSQIRANQAEVLQRALSKVELAEKHFVADRPGDVAQIVDELTRIAAANPSNIQAADALVASVPKALLEVIAERLGEFQKSTSAAPASSKSSKKKTVAIGDARVDSALEMIDSALAGGAGPGDSGWLSGSGTDAKSLMTQNNVLKAGMVLLRKKNSEMRAKIAALSTRKGRQSRGRADRDADPSSSPSPDGRRPNYKSSGNTTNDDSDEGADSAEQSEAEGGAAAASGENKRQQRERARRAQEAAARRMFNSLPADQQEYIWNILVSRVAEVVESHPLATSVSLHLKQETVLEVSLQVRELLASIMVLPLSELNVGRGGAGSALPPISLDSLFALVTRALSSTPVAMEIQVHANMIMAYLFTRFGDTGDGLESEASTYSLPAPDFPVAPVGAAAAGPPAGEYREGGGREAGEDYYESNDRASSASSHSSRGGDESREYYGSYTGGGAMEYMNSNTHTLRDTSKASTKAPPPTKPGYMGGTSTNKSKRFSTISSPRAVGSPGDKVASIRAQKMGGAGSQQGPAGKQGNDFKYYAYRKTSILNKELPVYNKKR